MAEGIATRSSRGHRRRWHDKFRWRFRLVKAGGYKPEARAKAIIEVPRRPDNPSATRL